jgi:hypothetical protein
VNRSQMDIKRTRCVTFEPGKNIYFSTYLPQMSMIPSHCFPSSSKPTVFNSFDCCLSQFHTSISTSLSSAKQFVNQDYFLVDRPTRWKSLGARIQTVGLMFKKFPLFVVLLGGGSLALKLYTTVQNSHFHHASANSTS